MKRLAVSALAILATTYFATPILQARELTFEDRVEAQEAIERVYYAHRSAASRSFTEAVPRDVLERKVRDYLDRSVALEEFWNRPVSAEALRRELERIAHGSKMPERLLELYRALGNEAFLIQETLARRTLVRRLTRNLFASDDRIHGEIRRQAEELRARVIRREVDSSAQHPSRHVLEVVRTTSLDRSGSHVSDEIVKLPPDAYARMRSRLPQRPGGVGPLIVELASFSFEVLLSEQPDRVEFAVYRLDKRTWEDWWADYGAGYTGQPIFATASESMALPPPAPANDAAQATSGSPEECEAGLDDDWEAAFIGMLPEAETATALWTGSEMIVWGGTTGVPIGTGARYDPLLDVWTQLSNENAPEPRFFHTAIWTGSEMIVWGGLGSSYFASGGRYDPFLDTWAPLATTGAPAGRYQHSAVWTGSEMIVWGGVSNGTPFADGGRYNPLSETWAPVSTIDAPTGRRHHSAVWTGDEMIVWGGGGNSTTTATGGRYDPAQDSWNETPLSGAPAPRRRHSAVWTGSEMIVFGGETAIGEFTSDGARFDPAGGGAHGPWAPVRPSGWAHRGHAAVWTGTEMIVWGGDSINRGERYNPSSNSWTDLPEVDMGSLHDERTAAVWTGSEMIVWHRGRGARYDPLLNGWAPDIHPLRLAGKMFHTAVWTGTEMIVWGGSFDDAPAVEFKTNTGGSYDPVLDTWDLTTLSNAPLPRYSHTAVWTGDEMIVWGGAPLYDLPYGTGGRYDPLTDSWEPVSTAGAADARASHTAIWTGNEMIVWGGSEPSQYLNTGGRYDPSGDSWTSVSISGAPEGRIDHTAVWTGSEMIVWGGVQSAMEFNNGGRYDPASDSWSPTSMVGAPPTARRHDAVWTGNEMIVWGDGAASRYDPMQNSWSPVPAAGAPQQRDDPSAVWTGDEMIVWGGSENGGNPHNDGGRFDPTRETWTATSLLDVPAPRYFHTAVWTGEAMVIWGGRSNASDPGLHSGFLYFAAADADDDGTINTCDCAPNDPMAFDVPSEIQNLGWLADAVTFAWDSDAPNSGTGTVYDVVRGDITGLPVGSGGEVCLEQDSAGPSSQDSAIPRSGSGFYYVVRGENVCDAGGYGADSFAKPRTTAACP